MLTWRELIANAQAKAAEHGDQVLDLPVYVGLSDENQLADGLIYIEVSTDEEEQLILTTNWD